VKIPLDYICVRTGVLCPRCRRLVESGAVSEFEINVMKNLIELEENDPEFRQFLNDFTYIKAYKYGDALLILGEFVSKQDQRILQRLAKALGEKLDMKVRIVSVASKKDIKSLVSQLIFPARVLGVNIIWLPDGSHQYIIRIPRTDLRYMPLSTDSIEKFIEAVSGENVKIRIE